MYVDFIEPCFGIGHNLSVICLMTSEDIKHQLIIIISFGPNAPLWALSGPAYIHLEEEEVFQITGSSGSRELNNAQLSSTV